MLKELLYFINIYNLIGQILVDIVGDAAINSTIQLALLSKAVDLLGTSITNDKEKANAKKIKKIQEQIDTMANRLNSFENTVTVTLGHGAIRKNTQKSYKSNFIVSTFGMRRTVLGAFLSIVQTA